MFEGNMVDLICKIDPSYHNKIKQRSCADGCPQLKYINKEESSSPTVSLYALMGSCVMDALNDR